MKFYFEISVLLFFSSCKEANLLTPYSENIICKWEQMESFGGNVGDIITPESTGKRILLEIKHNTKFKRYENDKKKFSGN